MLIQRGQAMVEYAVILALGIVVVIVILTLIGHQVHNVFHNVDCAIAFKPSCKLPDD